ncbi:efflux RND transporter periplasmic adaptor subunit [Desulfosoma caldarium]|uniref:RND family efflux transporter MFP subunit n=1 Tax=Desulfosoma caldarium TaxID=610254 RepID=A0A3N1UUG5_9BACT|nr:efflux RND transporter periplasmic adaptor subunit [Desulfosoma caldarium]ROQ92360.1 RND family efflux transporter MFP subunit [Desulfosoma caldarium]
MDKRNRLARWGILGVVLVIVVVLGLAVQRAKKRLASAPVWRERPVPMETDTVRRETLAETIRYLARLEPAVQATVSARLTADVTAVLVNEGDRVAKGDLLVTLDDRDLKAEVETLRAKVQALQAKLKAVVALKAAARKDAEYYRLEWKRDQALYEKKGISASAADSSRNRFNTALGRWQSLEAEVRSARREVKAAQAQLTEAETRLSYTRLDAPFDGVVRRRLVDPGDLAKAGVPLLELMDCSEAKLAFDAVQEDMVFLSPEQKLRVQWPEGSTGLPQEIAIRRIFPALEAAKSVRVEADFPWTCDTPLRFGSFVPVEAVVREGTGLSVSRRAVVASAHEGNSMVYVVREGRLKKVPVKVVLATSERVLVQGDLSEGEATAVGEYLQWVRWHEGLLVKVEERP